MSGHARCSASAAHRWLRCAGSVGESGAPSAYAAAGTFAHEIAAKCLTDESVSPGDFLCQRRKIDGFDVECDLEMVAAVQTYLDEIDEDRKDGDEEWVEMPLLKALQRIDPDLGGTSDRVRYRPSTKQLSVWDFKYGSGQYVEVEDNDQAKLYALGALLVVLEDGALVEEIEVVICQPRFEGAAPTRRWTFKLADVLDFVADVKEACARTRLPQPPLVAGDHCVPFCPKRRTCPELEKRQHALIAAEFGPLVQYDVAKLGETLASIPLVKERIKAIEEFAYAEANRGVEIPGFKLVDKIARRQWKSEGEAVLFAQERGIDPYEKSVLSPNQIEKKIAEALPKGKKKEAAKAIEHLVEKVSSGTALVPVSDERPPAKLVTAQDFPALPV